MEQVLGRLFRGRLARAHHAINLYQSLKLSPRTVIRQRIGNKRTAVDLIGVDRFDGLDAFITQPVQYFFCQLAVALEQDFATGSINNRFRNTTANKVLVGYCKELDARVF